MKHELTEEKLMGFLLQNAIEDKETKREIKMLLVSKPEEIREIIVQMETIQKELKQEANVSGINAAKKSYVPAAQCNKNSQQSIRFEPRRLQYQSQRNSDQIPNNFIQSKPMRYENRLRSVR